MNASPERPEPSARTKADQPRIGLFFTPKFQGDFVVLERSAAFEDVKTEAGLKTHTSGHMSIWSEIVRGNPSFSGYPE